MMKRWVHKTDLVVLRPAEEGEMLRPGQFAREGDIVRVHSDIWEEDHLLYPGEIDGYVEVEIPDDVK